MSEDFANDDLGKLADRYGSLKARIAELEEELGTVKEMLIESDQPVIEGALFRVTVTEVSKSVFDTQRFKVEYSDLFLMYQKMSSCVTVRCGSRTGKL